MNYYFYLNTLIGIVLNKYFDDCKCALHVSDSEFLEIANFPIMVFQSDADLSYQESQRCQGFVITSDNITEVVEKIELHIQRKSEVRYQSRKYIVISRDLDVFNFTYLHFLTNFLVVKPEDDYFELYTHRYVGLQDNNYPILLDLWYKSNQSFLKDADLYPNKMSNQLGRPLKVITSDYLPYCDTGTRTGSEMRAMVEYGNRHNVTLDIESTDAWGQIYPNWTGFGILGFVVMDLYDIGFSALFQVPSRPLYADFSHYTTYSRVSCIVPAPREEDSWFTHVKVFNIKMWSLIFGTYFSVGMTVYFAKKLRKFYHNNTKYFTPLSVVGIIVSHPIPVTQIPMTFKLRYIYTLTLMMTVLAATMYNSRLSSILVVPILVNEINTNKDLAQSGILWGELQIDWVIPLEVDTEETYRTLYENFRVKTEEELRQLSIENHFAFGIERLTSGYYAVGGYIKEDVINKYKVMKEDLYRQYTNFQLRKNSVIFQSLNDFLGLAVQSGLIIYWEAEAQVLNSNMKVQKSLRYNLVDNGALETLTIRHVKGVFLLWSCGMLLASLRFLYELHTSIAHFMKRRTSGRLSLRKVQV